MFACRNSLKKHSSKGRCQGRKRSEIRSEKSRPRSPEATGSGNKKAETEMVFGASNEFSNFIMLDLEDLL
jgi:hypothetical protein